MTKYRAIYPELINSLRDEMTAELRNHILPFWIELAVDSKNGGFLGRIDGNNEKDVEADKSIILNARLLWTFSAAYRVLGDKIYLRFAEKTYEYMENHFYDSQYGGFYWLLDHKGDPSVSKKHIYAQAFAIYGYSEFARATGRREPIERAVETFGLIETFANNEALGGYHEAFSRDWEPAADARLSDGDKDEQRSMNTHLHIMEAYSNLYRVNRSPELATKLVSITELMLNNIYNSETTHFDTFFDETWQSKADFYSYGHDIEAAWLLLDAAEVLEDQGLISRAQDVTSRVGYSTMNEGIDKQTGGVYNTGINGHPLDKDYHWWVQAEAIVGFLYSFEITNDNSFLETSASIWRFIKRFVKDDECGEWFFRLDEFGNPYHGEDKIGPWKCPYHNSRACLVLFERFSDVDESVSKIAKENSKIS